MNEVYVRSTPRIYTSHYCLIRIHSLVLDCCGLHSFFVFPFFLGSNLMCVTIFKQVFLLGLKLHNLLFFDDEHETLVIDSSR